jgi:hypothetical protein
LRAPARAERRVQVAGGHEESAFEGLDERELAARVDGRRTTARLAAATNGLVEQHVSLPELRDEGGRWPAEKLRLRTAWSPFKPN